MGGRYTGRSAVAKLDKRIETENGELDLCSEKQNNRWVCPYQKNNRTVAGYCTYALLATPEFCGLYRPVVFSLVHMDKVCHIARRTNYMCEQEGFAIDRLSRKQRFSWGEPE